MWVTHAIVLESGGGSTIAKKKLLKVKEFSCKRFLILFDASSTLLTTIAHNNIMHSGCVETMSYNQCCILYNYDKLVLEYSSKAIIIILLYCSCSTSHPIMGIYGLCVCVCVCVCT